MTNLIEQTRDKAGYPSNDALAKAILKHKPGLEDRIQARSLGVKIGGLSRGKTDWWTRNDDFLDVLTKLLDIERTDLGLHAGKVGHLFAFNDFPELPPLDLKRELPCALAYGAVDDDRRTLKGQYKAWPLDLEPWVTDREISNGHNMPHGITWLHATNETGADLLIAQLKARSPFDVLDVPSIQDARLRLQISKPFVLVLSLPVTMEDIVYLADARNATVLVIAPSPMPLTEGVAPYEYWLDWEFARRPKQEQAQRIVSGSLTGFDRYHWTLHDDWRQLLLSWVHSRLESKSVDTLFDEQEAWRWLEDFDPDEHLIRQPSDLLAICRMFHARSKKSRPAATGRDAARQLQSRLVSLDSRHTDVFNHIADELWLRADLPWAAPLDWSVWRELLPGGSSRPAGATVDGRLSTGKSSGASRKTTSRKTGPDKQLDEFMRKGLLISVPREESGDYALSPQLLADLRARDLLAEQIRSGDFHHWGRAALDAKRQYLVDAALSATPIPDLLSTIRNLQAYDPWNPSAIGATESLFLELGSRRAEGLSLPLEANFIAEVIFRRLMEAGTEWSSLLLTRRTSFVDEHPDTLKLTAACFGWSLTHRPKSSIGIDDLVLQNFPGWIDGSTFLPPMPDHPGESSMSTHGSPPRWRRFMKAVLNVLMEIPNFSVALGDEKINLAAPLLLTAALVQGKPVEPKWVREVNQHSWASDFVIEQLDQRRSAEIGIRTLRVCLDCTYEMLFDETSGHGYMFLFKSALWRWSVRNSRASMFIPVTNEKQLAVLRAIPQVLPIEWRQELLRSLPASMASENGRLIRCVGSDAWGLLLALLGTIEGGEAAKRLWEINPAEVLAILASDQLAQDATTDLVWNSPTSQAVEVAKYLSYHPGFLDKPQRREWVIARMGANVMSAGDLLALMQ